MNKILIIIRREFLYRLKKKTFLLLTLLMPFLIVGITFVPFLLGKIEGTSHQLVMVVDETGRYAQHFQSNATYTFQVSPRILPEFKEEASGIEAVVHITAPLDLSPDSIHIYSSSGIPSNLLIRIKSTLEDVVRKDKMSRLGVEHIDNLISDLNQGVQLNTVKWAGSSDEVTSNTDASKNIGMFFALLTYMFVLTYSGMVMQSVIEEKANRIVEIIISSVKPFQLMMGKIIGVGLVGLVQFSFWTLIIGLGLWSIGSFISNDAGLVVTSGMATFPSSEPSILTELFNSFSGISFIEIGFMFLLYFFGGYLLFASLFAAVGASINEQEDAAQFNTPLILILVFSLYAALATMDNPNGPLAFWASLFPLTAPVVMMVRIPFSVPLWQELLSLILLFGTALFSVWIGSRIYRVGILMYGKKPSFKEIFKWIRYH